MWTMCEFHDSNGNSLGDIWWTDKLICFSIIDIFLDQQLYFQSPNDYLSQGTNYVHDDFCDAG